MKTTSAVAGERLARACSSFRTSGSQRSGDFFSGGFFVGVITAVGCEWGGGCEWYEQCEGGEECEQGVCVRAWGGLHVGGLGVLLGSREIEK